MRCYLHVAISPEGIVVLAENIKDRDLISLYLIGSYISFKLGKTEKDALSFTELKIKTNKAAGTVAARLNELQKESCVEKAGKEYRITTFGIKRVLEEVIPKLKGGA